MIVTLLELKKASGTVTFGAFWRKSYLKRNYYYYFGRNFGRNFILVVLLTILFSLTTYLKIYFFLTLTHLYIWKIYIFVDNLLLTFFFEILFSLLLNSFGT